MSKRKKLFESEDFDKQKKLFTSDDFDKQGESTDDARNNNRSNEKDNIIIGNAEKTNGGKIIIGIAATAAILIGVYFFAFKDNGGNTNVDSTTERVAQTGAATVSDNSEIAYEANAESATPNAETAKPSKYNPQNEAFLGFRTKRIIF